MKKKTIITIGIGILVVILIIVGIIIFYKKPEEEPEEIIKDPNFVYAGHFLEEEKEENNIVFTNYEDYQKLFEEGDLTEEDFQENNYVLIPITYDICTDKNITPTDHQIENNNIKVTFKYERSCGICPPDQIYYLLKVDKSIEEAKVEIDYHAVNNPHCDPNVTYKPLIYLYPEKEMEITIQLGHPTLLTTTYPKYEKEWKVQAKPNGDLYLDNHYYYGLYWEGLNTIKPNFEDGFVVSKEKLIPFLEEKLTILGLSEKERNEFIIFWLPQLEQNKYNLIRFEDIDTINNQMPLEINPTPDSIIRVLMEYKPLNNKIKIKEQILTSPKREGYTLVEWGGTIIE